MGQHAATESPHASDVGRSARAETHPQPDPGYPVEKKVLRHGIKVQSAVTIARPADELYRFWRDFENLPRIFEDVESVTVEDDRHSHWVACGPTGRIEWDAEVINQIENELIAWGSDQDADVPNAGSVHFHPAPHGRGTEVILTFEYKPPGGKIGAVVARLFGGDPAPALRESLRRFKQLMEAEEIPTTEGQPSARKPKK
jgi:uncharacterized membrane protein